MSELPLNQPPDMPTMGTLPCTECAALTPPAELYETKRLSVELPSGDVAVIRRSSPEDTEQIGSLYEYRLSESERATRFFSADISAQEARERGLGTMTHTNPDAMLDLVLELFDVDTQTSEIIGHAGTAGGELHIVVPEPASAEDQADRRGLGTKLFAATILTAAACDIPTTAKILEDNVHAHAALKSAVAGLSEMAESLASWPGTGSVMYYVEPAEQQPRLCGFMSKNGGLGRLALDCPEWTRQPSAGQVTDSAEPV